MNSQHSSASNEHYTPPEFIEAARATMGGIDLDPASCEVANRIVKAKQIHTIDDDGLSTAWHGRVWLNPPGGRVGTRSSAAIWWAKLVEEWRASRVEQAVFLGFSIEILATSQDSGSWVGGFPFCVPRKRIEFLRQGADGALEPGESPTHANMIAYLPSGRSKKALTEGVERFAASFEKFGAVRT